MSALYRCLVLVSVILALVTSAPWILQLHKAQYAATPSEGSLTKEANEVERLKQEIKQLTEQLTKAKRVPTLPKINHSAANQEELKHQKQVIERLNTQLSNMQHPSTISTITDIEIARRFAKLPVAFLNADIQAKLLQKLIPDALDRWTCGIHHDHAADEKMLRQHPAMHSNLDGEAYFDRLSSLMQTFGWQRLQNKVFLEVGFGIGLTTALLRGLHTTIYATELFPIPWTPVRHGPFFEVLNQRAKIAAAEGLFGPDFDVELAASYGKRCGREVPGVNELRTTLEALEGVPDNSVDVSFSLAVMEHVNDPGECFKALARVHRLGSLTCHQVDLRDHTNFAKPWEFFLMSDKEFEQRTFKGSIGRPYFGNRVRLSEFVEAAHCHGFEVVHIVKNHEPATPEGLQYATETLSKLRDLDKSTHRYASWPTVDDWRCTSNNMPILGLLMCLEYVGGKIEGGMKIPCNEDSWTRKDFRLGPAM